MAKEHVIEHDLDQEAAREMARRTLDRYVARYPQYEASVRWADPDNGTVTAKAKGLRVEASMRLDPGRVVLRMDKVPLALRPLQGKVLERIDRDVRRQIADAARG